jgi:hypothetical protein
MRVILVLTSCKSSYYPTHLFNPRLMPRHAKIRFPELDLSFHF